MKFVLAALLTTAGLLAARTTWDGVYTDAQAKRGEALYAQKCAGCHGPELGGGDTAPSLTGPEFNAGWNDQTADDLKERIRVTMPADAPQSLNHQEATDILAFIFSKDGFPAGQTELPKDSPPLKEIKILVQKP